ncbi:MAG TPA: iron-containing alcohol dehydrogenase [Acidobacteriaceae bacterium]|nr:iron-containing alcohol dehydrogenase [Acidobacteriaceae bacterium]
MFDEITTFSFPTRIVFGAGATRMLPKCLEEVGIHRPLLVTDPGLRAAPPFRTVASVLEHAGLQFEVFDRVHPNPIEEDVVQAAESYRRAGCDGVIGLGGGSAIDVAKATVVMARENRTLADFEAQAGGMDRMTGPYDPIIAIPTTAGTGTEVGRSSVITSKKLNRKLIIFSPWLMPRRAILDPELTVSLPPSLTAATGMDAFTHCLESLTCPVYHPICDAIAIHGLELIIRYLERATRNGQDIEARGNMLVAASMGAIAFQKDLGATHSLAHPLSTEFGLHHGLANALCLPAVMRFNLGAAAPHYARLARLYRDSPSNESQNRDAAEAVKMVEAMIDRLGIQRGLRNHGVPRESLEALAESAFADSCHKTNIRPCTQDDLQRLYEESW